MSEPATNVYPLDHVRLLPTARQMAALQFVGDSLRRHGRPPTLREIGAHMGIRSTNGVNDHLTALERKGLVERDDMLTRGIRLTPRGLAVLGEALPMAFDVSEPSSVALGHATRAHELLLALDLRAAREALEDAIAALRRGE